MRVQKSIRKYPRTLIWVISLFLLTYCSGKGVDEKELDPRDPVHSDLQFHNLNSDEQTDLSRLVHQLSEKVSTLDQKISSLNDKISTKQSVGKTFQAVRSQPAKKVGVPVQQIKPFSESSGFTEDHSVGLFKKSMSLFDSQKYPETILALADFLRQYDNHPLSGAAQFYLGESYFYQNEFKLAEKEYSRVVIAYEQSSYVPDALKRLVEIYEKSQDFESAGKVRETLTSLFPNSPAASTLGAASITPELQSTSKEENAEMEEMPSAPLNLMDDMKENDE